MTDSNDIEAVEEFLYATLAPAKPQIKVAMILARAFAEIEFPPDATINMALDSLVLRPDIQSFGLIHK
jgi:hypothetical protein